MRRCFSLALLTMALSLALAAVSHAAKVVNGDFETGDFTGWTVVNQAGGSGDWFVYSGDVSPLSGLPIAAPPQGTFAATSDQVGPGSHILYQDVRLREDFRHTLSFTIYYGNLSGSFATPTPPTLDFSVFPNQQYRVDVLRRGAPVDSVAPGDVLATAFQTVEGDLTILGPTRVSVDLTCFADRKVRLRFAEVDNQFFFLGSVDDVRIASVRHDDDDDEENGHREESCEQEDREDHDDHGDNFGPATSAPSPAASALNLRPYQR